MGMEIKGFTKLIKALDDPYEYKDILAEAVSILATTVSEQDFNHQLYNKSCVKNFVYGLLVTGRTTI